MDAYRREVGGRLRDLRKAKNWSQEDAAHAVGVTSATWGRWERGRTSPYDQNWQKIEETFQVDARTIRGTPPSPLGLGPSAAGDQLDRIERAIDVLAGLAAATQADVQALRKVLRPPGEEPGHRRSS